MKQPCPGMTPILRGRAGRNAKRLRSFFIGHADEITELHDFGFRRMFGGEFVERLMNGEELVIILDQGQFDVLEVHALLTAAVTQSAFSPGAVNENSAHRLGRRSKEMGAVFKLRICIPDQPHPCLVDQRGGLERVTGSFVCHSAGREHAQLLIDQWQQLIGGFRVAVFDGVEKNSRVAHAGQTILDAVG